MLPYVLTFLELSNIKLKKRCFELVAIGSTFGWSYFIPQGVLAASLVASRKAFMATMKNPKILANMKKKKCLLIC